MKNESRVNDIQADIIWKLSNNPGLRFSEIRNPETPSDQFSYHLRQLLKYNVVEKDPKGCYTLTVMGKSRSLMLDARSKSFITQGFVAVRVVVTKPSPRGTLYLIQKRGRVPYKGYLGEPGGKVLFGEDVLDSAQRNLKKETGLTCQLELKGLMHLKDVYNDTLQQDKFFFVAKGTEPQGTLKTSGETGTNSWMTLPTLRAAKKVHFGVMAMIEMCNKQGFEFKEQTHKVREY